MAAFMNRRSRMAEVIAAVPTAAHAARRMKSRRVRTEMFFSVIKSFLDGESRRTDEEMDDGADTVAHLRGRRLRRGVGEIRGVEYVMHDVRLAGAGQWPRQQHRSQSVN